MAGTTIWMRESVPTPSHQQLQALVLGMVYGEVTWNNQPGVTHYHYAGMLFYLCLIKVEHRHLSVSKL